MLAEALNVNKSITGMGICNYEDLGDNMINAEGAQAISESLKLNSTLTWIGALLK
jgi:hypothetical protein